MGRTNKYKSQICISGKRRGDMESMISSIFGESFLNVELSPDERMFIIRIAIYSDEDVKKIINLQSNPKFELCQFVTFKPIKLNFKPGQKN